MQSELFFFVNYVICTLTLSNNQINCFNCLNFETPQVSQTHYVNAGYHITSNDLWCSSMKRWEKKNPEPNCGKKEKDELVLCFLCVYQGKILITK